MSQNKRKYFAVSTTQIVSANNATDAIERTKRAKVNGEPIDADVVVKLDPKFTRVSAAKVKEILAEQ